MQTTVGAHLLGLMFHPLPFWLALHFFLLHFFLLLFSHLVVSDFLWSHGLQYARLSCPSLSPGACSNVCPLSWWCHPTISSSVVPFSSCLQSFPASGSFLLSQFFPSGGQSFGASTSAFKILVRLFSWNCPQSLFLRIWHWCYSKSILRTLRFLKTKDAFLHLYFFSNNPIVYGVCVCVLSCFSHVWLFETPMNCTLPGSSIYGIFLERILKWVSIPSSRGSSWTRDQVCVSCVSCMQADSLLLDRQESPCLGHTGS